MASPSANQLTHLRQQFAGRLPQKVDQMARLWQHWVEQSQSGALHDLETFAHQLAGSAGSHGFAQVGEVARRLEQAVVALGSLPEDPEAILLSNTSLKQLRHLARGLTQSQASVLVIDDDPDMRDVLRELLKAHGYQVWEADSGYSGIKLARLKQPDVILLDVKMPAMDGYETCFHLQQEVSTALIPVVIVTALEDERDQAQAFQVGASDFLVKPVTESGLLQTVGRSLARGESWQELAGPCQRQDAAEVGNDLDFDRFKRFLGDQLSLDLEGRQSLKRAEPETLYADCREMGIESQRVAREMAAFAQVPFMPEIDGERVKLGVFPAAFSRTNLVLALENEGHPDLVVSNLFNRALFDRLVRTFGEEGWEIAVAPPESIWQLVADRPEFQPVGADAPAHPPPLEPAQSSVVGLVNEIIEAGHRAGASDIHVEPREDAVVVRCRVDGRLTELRRITPRDLIVPLVARIKVMAGMDISERRLPQDGRIVFSEYSQSGADFDLRVASAPMNFGEKVVMRIIDKQRTVLSLEELGFSQQVLVRYRDKIKAPYGMILHVGPTGSGKSMTLYAALNELNSGDRNIQTAEDPIEYTLPGLNQLQVNPKIGLTFASALRSYLRQDPDIILLGEIRDRETAQMAVEASLTGHLLLSTLHTNDAASTVTRLVEMGIEPYMLSAGLVMVCAQRLVRRLCPECREAYTASEGECRLLGLSPAEAPKLFRARGCRACQGIGYRGRFGIHELLIPDDRFRHLISQPGVTNEQLKTDAVTRLGMRTLFQEASIRVADGLTSLAEVLEQVHAD